MESNLMTAEGQAQKQNTSTPSGKTGDLKSVRSQGTQTELLSRGEGNTEIPPKASKQKKYG